MNLRAGGLCEFETPQIEFRMTEAGSTLTGNKYYGYRVRFYYKDTLVRTIAVPTVLADWDEDDTTR